MECPDRTAPAPECSYYIKGGFCKLSKMFRCIEYVYNIEAPISHSSIHDFTQCKRKYYHSTIQGLTQKEPPIRMLMGSIWSEVLDAIHTNEATDLGVKDRVTLVLAKYKALYAFETEAGSQIPKELAQMDALSQYYGCSEHAEVKGTVQAEFRWAVQDAPGVHGFADLLVKLSSDAPCWSYEFKYSSNPDNYNKFTVSDQLSTYFIGLPELQRTTVRVFQVPLLKQGKDEDLEQYRERVYNDIVSRPRHYVKDQTYWRSEFKDDMDQMVIKARLINEDIHRTLSLFSEGGLGIGAWLQNKLACFSPGPCQFLPICENGNVSDDIYTKREVK